MFLEPHLSLLCFQLSVGFDFASLHQRKAGLSLCSPTSVLYKPPEPLLGPLHRGLSYHETLCSLGVKMQGELPECSPVGPCLKLFQASCLVIPLTSLQVLKLHHLSRVSVFSTRPNFSYNSDLRGSPAPSALPGSASEPDPRTCFPH